MKCKYCNYENDEKAKICEFCGNELQSESNNTKKTILIIIGIVLVGMFVFIECFNLAKRRGDIEDAINEFCTYVNDNNTNIEDLIAPSKNRKNEVKCFDIFMNSNKEMWQKKPRDVTYEITNEYDEDSYEVEKYLYENSNCLKNNEVTYDEINIVDTMLYSEDKSIKVQFVLVRRFGNWYIVEFKY